MCFCNFLSMTTVGEVVILAGVEIGTVRMPIIPKSMELMCGLQTVVVMRKNGDLCWALEECLFSPLLL